MDKQQFIHTVAPLALQLRKEGSAIFPSVRIAQSLLETGGEIHPWYNLGGIKVGNGQTNAYWKGAVIHKKTWEVYEGRSVEVTAGFRAYDSIYDFYKDQDLLYGRSRYAPVRAAKTPEEQAEQIYRCGYATDAPASVDGDPAYYEKMISLINKYDLRKYDEMEDEEMLKEDLEALKKVVVTQGKEIERLTNLSSMPVPDWAKKAVDAAVKDGIVSSPDDGSYDFYRFLTVLHNKGLI